MYFRRLSSFLSYLFILTSLSACATLNHSQPKATSKNSPQATVILISIDGARYDYLERFPAPHLQALAQQGVRADFLKPVFPSKTFPNHYSLVTGLHPEKHGLVNNSMYDPEYDVVFSMGKREEVENSRWWGGEPIWVTAEKQGVTAATFFFPGSETAVQGIRPTYWYNYDGSISNRTRIEQVLAWLDLPAAERPQLITLYFSDVDTAGHFFGPNSPEVAESFQAIDAEIGVLLAGLAERQLSEQVTLLITSDHGMQEVNPQNHFVLDGSFDESLTQQVMYSRETISLHASAENIETLYQQLSTAIPADFGHVLRKDQMPARFQYSQHRRIGDLLLLANPGNIWVRQQWLDDLTAKGQLNHTIGSHGYDNEHSNMFGLFIGVGPQLKQARTVPGFDMVDVYQVMAALLGIQAAPHDGNPAVLPTLLNVQE